MKYDGYLLLSGFLFAILLGFTFALLYPSKGPSTRKVARIGVMLALALVLGLVESFIPDVLLPGMRLGLANVVVLLVLYVYGFKEGLALALGKALLVSFLRGNFLSMGGFMALTGTMVSFFGMAVLHYGVKRCSVIGVSVVGALLHVFGQVLIAYLYLGPAIWGYLPWLLVMAMVTGVGVGLLVLLLLRRTRFVASLEK